MAQIENVETRSIASEAVTMWGMLHVSRPDGTVAGWLVNSWSTSNEHRLPIRMHWVPKDDGKFYRVKLSLEPRLSILQREEDTDIESHRAAFITVTLALWEQEWMDAQLKS
jgi:hypothetical protein